MSVPRLHSEFKSTNSVHFGTDAGETHEATRSPTPGYTSPQMADRDDSEVEPNWDAQRPYVPATTQEPASYVASEGHLNRGPASDAHLSHGHPSGSNIRARHAVSKDSSSPQPSIAKPSGGQSKKSLNRSLGTNGSFNSQYPNSSEVSETYQTKLVELKWVILSLIVNSFGFWLVHAISTVLLQSVLTERALNAGASAYFASLLAGPKGYSLACCGFLQARSFLDKASFSTYLALHSSSRAFFSKSSVLWLFLNLSIVLGPISASMIVASAFRTNSGTVECLIYQESGQQLDRRYPNVVYESGISEVIFGTSLGIPRSEFNVPFTVMLTAPQIIGAVQDGDTISGPGYNANILTNCNCANSGNASDLINAGAPGNPIAARLATKITGLNGAVGMINYVDQNITAGTVSITFIITGTYVCGGVAISNPPLPVCTTVFSNHTKATVLVSYMTDGTTASIAQKQTTLVSLGDTANSTWIYNAMIAILDGQLTSHLLPSTVTGMTNPLLWWTTTNLMTIDPALLAPGIETIHAILYRAGVERTYATHGTSCDHNVAIAGKSNIIFSGYGSAVAYALVGFQFLITLIAFAGYIPWIRADFPLGPIARMTRDRVYLLTLLHSTTMYNPDTLCNAPPQTIWQALDVVVRVGETVTGKDEEIVGHITMDVPKFIVPLTNGKRYN